MSEMNCKRGTIKVERDGLELEGPARVSRGGYIRVYVKVVSSKQTHAHYAWADAVNLAYSVYGVIATEDNTIGQIAQVDGAHCEKRTLPVNGRTFSLGLNLYGRKVRELNRMLASFPKAGEA